MVYLRLGLYHLSTRKQVHVTYEGGSEFTIDKADVLRDGGDFSLIASGMAVIEMLKVADMLQADGIGTRVVDMFTIKPIDMQCIIECARQTGAIVTAENYNVVGGLGSVVAEVLSEHEPVYLERIGVLDKFGEVWERDYLMKWLGLTAEVIYEKAKHVYAKRINDYEKVKVLIHLYCKYVSFKI